MTAPASRPAPLTRAEIAFAVAGGLMLGAIGLFIGACLALGASP